MPSGSANINTTVTITEFDASDPALPPPPADFDLLGQVVDVSTDPPATFSSENPATLEIRYDQSLIGDGVNEANLEVLHFDGTAWQPIGEPCAGGAPGSPLDPDPCIAARDTDNNKITIKTTQFSYFALGLSRQDARALRIGGTRGPNLSLISGCSASPCTATQTHKLVVGYQGTDADLVRTVYRIIGLPDGCTVNGLSGGSIVLFDETSAYTPGQRKTFTVSVTYSCPLDPNLSSSGIQLRLDVDHLGDDYPLPDNDDSVPSNNTRIKSKFIG